MCDHFVGGDSFLQEVDPLDVAYLRGQTVQVSPVGNHMTEMYLNYLLLHYQLNPPETPTDAIRLYNFLRNLMY